MPAPFKLNAPWEEVKEKLKEANNLLTNADLEYEEGKEEALLLHLADKMRWDPTAVRNWIESVAANSGIAS